MPKASPVAVLFLPRNPVHKLFLKEMEAAASPLGARVLPVPIGAPADIPAAFEGMARQGVASVLVLPDDPFVIQHRRRFIEMAAKHGLPSFFGLREAVDDGGLMSYGESLTQTHFRAAYYVDRILKGANPGELPVEQPTRFELVVNQKTARALGVTIPRSVLHRADRVIE
ncbi:ABC transporter substrate-binding protein [Variovorax sp. LjRoot84]|uniref:ABC transporter substrate-binding protein n=1 Tax=unclassified Variovorax TaxID=663243 RepID=UPI003ED0B99C